MEVHSLSPGTALPLFVPRSTFFHLSSTGAIICLSLGLSQLTELVPSNLPIQNSLPFSSHIPKSYAFCKAQSVTRSSEKTSFDWKNLSLLWTPGTLTSFHPCIMYLLFNHMPCLPKWVILNPYRVKILFFIYYFSSTYCTLKVQWRLNSFIFVPQSCGSKETWMIMPPTDTQRSPRQSGTVMGSRAEPQNSGSTCHLLGLGQGHLISQSLNCHVH